MYRRGLAGVVACVVSAMLLSAANPQKPAPDPAKFTCPVTKAAEPAFVPPSPYPAPRENEWFYFGSEKLWTLLRPETWHGVPHNGNIRVKHPWFALNIGREEDGGHADISVRGRRLDDQNAAPLLVEGPGVGRLPEYAFFPSILEFPSAGCWEITAKRKQSEIRFVIEVQ